MVKDINKFLAYNVANPIHTENATEISLTDLIDLKESRDYLDQIFKQYTQTIRNDTYKPNGYSYCQSCKKPKDTFKILCFDCVTK